MKTTLEILIVISFPIWIMFFPPKNTLSGRITAAVGFIAGAVALLAVVNS